VLPTPTEGLAALGSFVRAARVARGINQKRAAEEAQVSRRQLAILENGGNISVEFLLKVARYLGLSAIPLDGTVQLVAGQAGLNVHELLKSVDFLAVLVDHVRCVAMDAVLPPSERATSKDTPALKEFVQRHATNADGFARLAEAIFHLDPTLRSREPALPGEDAPAKPRRAARRRGVRGE
jgi:transcriptional regulator with XRE-family HTH domain